MVVTILVHTQSSIVLCRFNEKIDTNPDRIRSDSRDSRPKILGFPMRTKPVSGFGAMTVVSAAVRRCRA